MIRAAFTLFFRKLRLSEPWNYKAPLLISIPYLFLYAGHTPFPAALLAIFCSLGTIIGIAGFGYFCNDLADRDADLKAGIPNGTQHLTKWQTVLIFALFLAIALTPWILYFPLNRISICLLANQFLLFIVYAAPPFRLKDRGLPGIIADALYAHANPALLAAYTFYLLTGQGYAHFPFLLATLVSWQFFLGLRNILQHQIQDVANDRAAGSNTYAVQIGEKAAFRLMKRLLVPLELSGFILFICMASIALPALALAWPLYVCTTAVIILLYWKEKLFTPFHNRLCSFVDHYYLRWLPLVVLAALCLHDLRMGLLVFIHLTLFNNEITPFFKHILFRSRRVYSNPLVRMSLMADQVSLPLFSVSEAPANPGEPFIWQEPFKPIVTIEPHKPAATDDSGGMRTRSQVDMKQKKKAFFIGFNRLGDFLCTTPVIRSFRQLNPLTFITYIVQDAPYCKVLEGNPDIDRIIYSKELYQHGEKILSEEWLRTLPIDIEEPSYLYRFNIHEVCRVTPTVFNDHISRGFARVLGIPVDSVRPVVRLSQTETEEARALVKKPYILISMHASSEVVATGGHRVLKDWLLERWLRLAKSIHALGDVDVIAVGAETDLQVPSRYFRNLYGLPIKVVAALLREAACVVTVESGILHLCHAVDAPVVAIFSRYVPFSWAFPREAGCCRIIYKDPRSVSSDEVFSAVKSILYQKGNLS